MIETQILYGKYTSSVSQFINILHSWIYCNCTLNILLHFEPKITLFYLLSVSRFYSFSFVVPLVIICCHSLSLVASLVVLLVVICFPTCCHLLHHSLSFVVPRCHSLPLVVLLVVTCCHSMYHSSAFLQTIIKWNISQ